MDANNLELIKIYVDMTKHLMTLGVAVVGAILTLREKLFAEEDEIWLARSSAYLAISLISNILCLVLLTRFWDSSVSSVNGRLFQVTFFGGWVFFVFAIIIVLRKGYLSFVRRKPARSVDPRLADDETRLYE